MAKIQLDKKAPDFKLEDFNQKPVALSDFRYRKNVLLVFNRGFV